MNNIIEIKNSEFSNDDIKLVEQYLNNNIIIPNNNNPNFRKLTPEAKKIEKEKILKRQFKHKRIFFLIIPSIFSIYLFISFFIQNYINNIIAAIITFLYAFMTIYYTYKDKIKGIRMKKERFNNGINYYATRNNRFDIMFFKLLGEENEDDNDKLDLLS